VERRPEAARSAASRQLHRGHPAAPRSQRSTCARGPSCPSRIACASRAPPDRARAARSGHRPAAQMLSIRRR
jgi:hypothetical protein